MKNLILGFAEGYRTPQVEIFVRSLRATRFDGDVVLFVDHRAPRDYTDYLAAHDIRAVRTEWRRQAFASLRPLVALERQLTRRRFTPEQFAADGWIQHATMARYECYRRFLADAGREHRWVLFTDVRDVVFQDDPFRFDPGREICLFEEPGQPLAASGSTAKWIRRSYGATALTTIAERPVLCAGVMLGTRAGMLALIRSLTDVMARAECFWALRFGLDQAALNLLVHADIDGFASRHDVGLFRHGTGVIAHLAMAEPRVMREPETGLIIDRSGRPIPTIHQYDRHAELRADITRRHASAAA